MWDLIVTVPDRCLSLYFVFSDSALLHLWCRINNFKMVNYWIQ